VAKRTNERPAAAQGRSTKRAPATGRTIAARVLERVDRDDAFAAAALDAELARHPQLDARERGFATELVYGVLRTRDALLRELERFAPRGLPRADSVAIAHMLVAAHQLLTLERVPAFAAVDAAVGAITEARGPGLAGFANAVLRKLAASGKRLDATSARRESTAAWLVERLEQAVGAEEASALIGSSETPPLALRLVGTRALPESLGEAKPGKVSPLSRLLRRAGDPRLLEGFDEGAFVVQEEGAQLVALAVGARAAERVLDACAGRGQKASLLAERVGAEGSIWAADVHPAKLRALEQEFRRLSLPPPRTAAVDWSLGSGDVPGGFDRVLVDAPCTGVGTLRRRPEIAQRLKPDDPTRLGVLASEILLGAGSRARPGGRVIFAVCSVLPEECEAVVARVRSLLEPAPFDAPELAGIVAPDMTSFRLLPRRHGTDGYFVASFVRRA
jgi:16S rRNA (cytosine967-C5)-methyltransferase